MTHDDHTQDPRTLLDAARQIHDVDSSTVTAEDAAAHLAGDAVIDAGRAAVDTAAAGTLGAINAATRKTADVAQQFMAPLQAEPETGAGL